MLQNLLNVLMLLLIQKKNWGGDDFHYFLIQFLKLPKSTVYYVKLLNFSKIKNSLFLVLIFHWESGLLFSCSSPSYTRPNNDNLYNKQTYTIQTRSPSVFWPSPTVFIYHLQFYLQFLYIFFVREFFFWKFTRNYAFLKWEQSGTH